MEVTIAPQNRSGPFQRPESDEADDEAGCNLEKIQVDTEGEWTEDEGMEYGGPQRLKMWLADQPGVQQLKFHYYLKEFGSVRIPQRDGGLEPIAFAAGSRRLRIQRLNDYFAPGTAARDLARRVASRGGHSGIAWANIPAHVRKS